MDCPNFRERLRKRGGVFLTVMVVILLSVGLETFQRVKNYFKERKRGRNAYSIGFETWSGLQISHIGGSITLVHYPHLIYRFKEAQRTREVTINLQAFRGADWTQEPSSLCRVVVLGGSATFGIGASNDEKVFTRLLERLLNDGARHRSEVYNAGVIGYGSKQELILLTSELLDYQPDLVVIFDGWNDFYFSGVRPTGAENAFSPTFFNFDEILSPPTQRWANFLRMSAFFRWAEGEIRTAIAAWGPPRRFHHYSDNLAVYLPEYRSNLVKMVRFARAYGSDVLIVSQPELFHRTGQIPQAEQELRLKFNRKKQKGYAEFARTQYPSFVQAARDVAASEGVPFVDATIAFDEFDGAAFVDFVHFGDEGHKRLAHYLLEPVSRVLNQRVRKAACHERFSVP